MNEEWRDIEEYEGLYQVSNLGRVKSLKFGKEKILKFGKHKKGYLLVCLCKDGKQKMFQVHRLVAIAFIPNPNNYQEVNHKDENKENNCVENLEWCTREYNVNYGTRTEKCVEKSSKEIIQLDLQGKEVARFPSVQEVQRQFGFSQGNISSCCNGKLKTAYKYKWIYI